VIHILISLLLDNITALAPDENFYVSLFNRSYSIDQNVASVPSWSNSSGIFIKILYFPAFLLSLLGLDSLQSLRFESILASALALNLLWATTNKSFQDSKTKKTFFVILSCIPTVFLWQSLALRESYLFLGLSSVFFLLYRFRERINTKHLILLVIAMTCLLFTKDYLYVILAASIGIAFSYGILRSKFQERRIGLVLLAVILPILVFIPQTKGIIQSTGLITPTIAGTVQGAGKEGTVQGAGKEGTVQGAGKEGTVQGAGKGENGSSNYLDPELIQIGGGTIHLLSEQLESNRETIIFKFLNLVGIYDQIKESAQLAYSEPESDQYAQSVAQLNRPVLERITWLNIIDRTGTFLFVPTLGIDNGSLFLNLQSLELPFWLLLYGTVVFSLYRNFRVREITLDTLTVYIFILLFIGISSITEVNIGTALRHRSILIVPAMFLLVQLKPNRFKNKQPRMETTNKGPLID